MAGLTLKQLVESIAAAVADAQQQVQVRQVRNLLQYFDEDGRPKMLEMLLPDMRTDAPLDAQARYRVPLITLTHPAPLRITDATIDFKVDLIDLAAPAPPAPADVSAAGRPSRRGAAKAKAAGPQAADARRADAGQHSGGGDREVMVDPNPQDSGLHASITVRVASGEGPEGLQRMLIDLARTQGIFQFVTP